MARGVKLFFDGGCRPLPIGMETAVVAGGREVVRTGLGAGTSMTAEWLALIDATRFAVELGVEDAVLLGDAAAVVAQANGAVRCPPAHAAHLALFREMPRPARLRIRYVKRTQNLAGIALARRHAR